MNEIFIQIPGGRVYCKTVGDDAPGVPLLVVHGGPGIPHDYLEPLDALAAERPVIFYDQLGCGRSDRPQDLSLYALPRYVEELAAVRAALGLSRAHLLGQSWGATIVTEYMLTKAPKGVASLVLSGPCLDVPRFVADQRHHLENMPGQTRAVIQRAEASGDFASEDYQQAMMAFYAKHVCRMAPWPGCLNRALAEMNMVVYGHMWGPSEFTTTGTLKDLTREGELHRLRGPVLITCGRHDEARPETMAEFQARIPGAELAILEDASHSHHLEQPEAYLAIVSNFLRRAEAKA